ncbi:hypothetical protein HDU79_008151 [Rhizoclosmatium sp. JEL0117]|nr:hypothetical protein HDU79_008151 [Rhizoclosmatium sp. JEL0117]
MGGGDPRITSAVNRLEALMQPPRKESPITTTTYPNIMPNSAQTITTQLHINPTQIPPPQSFTHPTLGPTVSWTTTLLAENNIHNPSTELTDAQRRAFTQCDALILAAVKERNQFLEISRALVAECGKHREIANKYLGIVRQLVGIVPMNVRVGVKMDLEAIERFARSEVSISPTATVAPVVAPPQRPPPQPSVPLHHTTQPVSRQSSHERFDGYEYLIPSSSGKRMASPTSTISDKRFCSGESRGTSTVVESPDLDYRKSVSLDEQEQDDSAAAPSVPTVGDSPNMIPTDTSSAPAASIPSQESVAIKSTPANTANQVILPPSHQPVRRNLPPIMQVNPPTEYKLSTKVPNKDVVCAMALSRPFKYLFSACLGSIKIWDVSVNMDEAPQVGTIELNKENNYIRAIKITPDGKTLVAGGEGQDPHIVAKLPTGGYDTYTLTISHDSRTVLIGGRDNCIQMWDLVTRQFIRTFQGHTGAVTCTTLSRDGKKLYSGSCDGTIRLWDMPTSQCLETFHFPSAVHSFDLNPLIPILTVGLEDGVVQRYLTRPGAESGEEEVVYLDVGGGSGGDGDKMSWGCVRYSRSGLWFAVAGMGGKMCVFKEGSMNSGGVKVGAVKMCEVAAEEGSGTIICAEVSSCGNYVVTGGGNKVANVFRVTA